MPTGNLPGEGKKLFEEVYQKALKGSCKGDKGCAAGSAWKAVHNAGWRKNKDGQWVKGKSFTEFSLRIDRASYDKASGERRFRAVASDTDEDSRQDNMSLELFNDFIDRIKRNEPVPEEFQSEFWKSGEPYLSVSHYTDLEGKGVPGLIDATYVDGNYLKSKGKFRDTPLGRKCFEAVCSDLYGETKDREDKIRISIAFLDYMHKHKSNGFVFDRKNSKTTYCPECVMEALTGESQGKIFLRGQLIHEALTRVPVNTRTSLEVDKSMADKILTRKDDAASIVGDELADELEEQAELVGKSDALVIRSDEEEVVEESLEEAPGDAEDECQDPTTGEVDPECTAKKVGEVANSEAAEVIEESEEVVEKATKTEGGCSHPSSHFLVVGDPQKVTTWHLRFKDCSGKVDTRLLGAAKAALTSPGGHRGNKYAGPDKSKAIAKLKRLYSSHGLDWNSKSDAEYESEIYDLLQEIKSMTVKSEVEEPEVIVHPLDEYFSDFKQRFDAIIDSEASSDEKLHQIQEPFSNLGDGVVSVIKSSIKPKEVPPEEKAQMDIVKALVEAMNPTNQKLDLLITQLSTPPIERKMPVVPQRRSISPAIVQQVQEAQQQSVAKSETPKLRAIIEKTTY